MQEDLHGSPQAVHESQQKQSDIDIDQRRVLVGALGWGNTTTDW